MEIRKEGIKMQIRNYGREYEKDKARDTFIQFRIHKDKAERFKEKLRKENKTMSEFIKEKIDEYLDD